MTAPARPNQVIISEDDLARYLALEARHKAFLAKHKKAGKCYYEEHADRLREQARERRKHNYQKIKEDPERLLQVRFQEAVAVARKRLQTSGGLTQRTKPEIVAALNLVWDDEKKRWVPPPIPALQQ